MIHRQNWLDVRAYLHHIAYRVGRDPATVEKYRQQLRHLIEWADETPLPKAHRILPGFPRYLLTARNDGKTLPVTYSSIVKALNTARNFFRFARIEWTHRYRGITDTWINLLQPPRAAQPTPQLDEHRFYRLEEVRTLARVSTETLHEARAQAAACMLFLSGMRPDSLASLPVQCVDLPNRRILQIPTMGIRTKFNKAAITYLLDVPELYDVVAAWDRRVRTVDSNALWFPGLTRDGMQCIPMTRAIQGRVSVIGDDLRLICKKAGVPYLSPHKMRHGHIVYARNLAQNMAQLKAVSQNVMHASVLITDQVYSALIGDDVGTIIANLGRQASNTTLEDKIQELLTMLQSLK